MTYYKDLEEYKYTDTLTHKKALCVGWLSSGKEFPKEEIPKIVGGRLLPLCIYPENLMRGYHVCEFCAVNSTCPEEYERQTDLFLNKVVYLGNGEIHIPGKDNKLYVAPTLIHHYIKFHQYKPPQEFIDSLMSYSSFGFTLFLFSHFIKRFILS